MKSKCFFSCEICLNDKSSKDFPFHAKLGVRLSSICHECSDTYLVESVEVVCTAGCGRKLPSSYYTHYKTRFKSDGNRLRVNTNCKDCTKKESKIVRQLKKENPPPKYLTCCPQCDRIVYEKSEDIPEGVNGTNGPWQCDHDHITGQFRAYLCKQCNIGRGLVGDNLEGWTKAVKTKNKR